MGPKGLPPVRTGRDLESTVSLLTLARQGDASARDRLFRRYVPVFRSWARGRLPSYARDLSETDDLVQLTLLRALSHLHDFEARGEDSFLAFLRRVFLNVVRDEIRRAHRLPTREVLQDQIEDRDASALETTLGREALERYERALTQLSEDQREALILRLEFGFEHPEIAKAMGKTSANAARMVLARAMARLVERMDEIEA